MEKSPFVPVNYLSTRCKIRLLELSSKSRRNEERNSAHFAGMSTNGLCEEMDISNMNDKNKVAGKWKLAVETNVFIQAFHGTNISVILNDLILTMWCNIQEEYLISCF